ncbi:MAG: response regulator [Planctomycetales bacterium]|nr:response regulator [Planctomycetales bacterium]
MRRLLGRFLEAAGAGPPMEAADGDQAIALFKPGGFDLVICDVNIPKRDGFEVMREIRKQDADVPIIVITTEAGEEMARRARKAGANEYLVKPFDVEARQKLLSFCQLAV